jgi:AsmA family protein
MPGLVRLDGMATNQPTATPTRATAVLKWTGILVVLLAVVLLITLMVFERNADALRGPIARMATAHLGRPVRIDGRLELHLLTWTPRAVVRELHIANPDWVTPKESGAAATATASHARPTDMVRIGQLQVSLSIPALFKGEVLLPYVGIDDSDIDLVRDKKQRANWDFGTSGPAAKPSSQPTKLPMLGRLHLGGGHLVVADEVRKLRFKGAVSADQAANGGAQSLSLSGDGSINGEPFELKATGDPLITAESHHPYTVTSDIQAGKTKVKSTITLTKPFDMGSVVADISASGDDLADLYYLSGLALPNTAPYTVSSHLQREGSLLKLTRFKGTLGNSDIHGTLSIETAAARPLLTADLSTRLLDIKDLGPTLGSKVKTTPSSLGRQQAHSSSETAEDSTAKARAAAPHAAKTDTAQDQDNPTAAGNTLSLHGAKPKSAQTRTAEAQEADAKAAHGETLLPDAKLDLQRIRAMDANVKYHAEAVKTDKMSIQEIALALRLDNGVLTFTPVSFVLPQGKLTSNIRVDGSKDVPEVEIDARVTQVRLSQFKTKDGQEPLDGTLVGRAILHGRGRSLHEIGSTAAGTLSIAVPHGDIRAAFAELLGINAARGVGLLLTKNQEKTGIRCGVANFKAEGGVFAAQDIVIDTDNVLILGKGEIDLGPEVLDITLNGQPKKVRLFRIKSPVELGGTLSKPKVGLKPGNTPGQIALATALGVLATPLASVLAFIDPGLAKDADCGALLAEAQREGAPNANEGPPTPKEPGKDAPIKDAQRSTKARSIT